MGDCLRANGVDGVDCLRWASTAAVAVAEEAEEVGRKESDVAGTGVGGCDDAPLEWWMNPLAGSDAADVGSKLSPLRPEASSSSVYKPEFPKSNI